jgi:DNA-binding NarL/FixJ family response regulator
LIADRLGIAASTVALVLRSAMAKLGACTRLEAVARLRDGA